jgi:glyoxylase-like metal-dependent hydrolase (beta-lactamase superfamily II)
MGHAMRQLDLPDGVLFTFTDAAPPPAALTYSFPDADPAGHPDVIRTWLPDHRFHTRFAVFALEQRGRIVLIDAGLGPQPSPYFDGLTGRLQDELSRAGIDVSAVAHVLFTHFHLDHIGWAAHPDGTPFFPNATYHAPRAELAHWKLHGAEAALPHHVQAFERSLAPLIAAGLMAPDDPAQPILELDGMRVTYRAVPGHTPGHHAIEIAGRETVLIAGDAWHSPAQIAVPDWCHRADFDPAQARRSRIALSNWAHDHGAIVASGHFLEPICFGRIGSGRETRLEYRPIGAAA